MKRNVVLGICSLVFCAVWCVLFTPIHVSIDHSASSAVKLTANAVTVPSAFAPSRTLLRTKVTVSVLGNGYVELALPVDPEGRRLRFDQLEASTGTWLETYGGSRIESHTAGSSVELPLAGSQLMVDFLHRADGGSASITYQGGIKNVNLRGADYGWQPEAIQIGQVKTVATISVWRLLDGFHISLGDGGPRLARGEVRFGDKAVLQTFSISPGQSLKIAGKAGALLGHFLDGAADLGRILALAAAWLILTALCGLGCMVLLRISVPAKSQAITALGFGCSLLPLAANSLSYVIPMAKLGYWLWLPLLMLAAAGVYELVKRRLEKLPGDSRGGFPVSVLLIALFGVWMTFWPIIVTGSQAYLGYLQADSFYYTTLSNSIGQTTLLSLAADGGLVGHGMRSLDVSTVAALCTLTGLTPNSAWLVTMIALMVVPPIAAFYLICEWMEDRTIAFATSAAVALSAPLAGLFFEAYFTQYLLTPLLYLNLYGGYHYLRACGSGLLTAKSWLLMCATSTAILLLFPYFAVPSLVMFASGAWLLRTRPRHMLVSHATIGATALIAGNIGFLFFAGSSVAVSFTARLNEIAINVVFPFYADAKFPAFVAGLPPFHGSPAIFAAVPTWSSDLYSAVLAGLFTHMAPSWLIAGICFIAFAYLTALIFFRAVLLDHFGRILAEILLAYCALMLLIYHVSGLYAYAKLAWTFATFLPLIVAPVLLYAIRNGSTAGRTGNGRPFGRSLRMLASVAFGLFICTNALSRFAEPSLWLIHPYSPVGSITYTRFAIDLDGLHKWTRRLASNDVPARELTYRFAGDNGATQEAFQLLAGQSNALLGAAGFTCTNCQGLASAPVYRFFTTPAATAVPTEYVIGIGKEAAACISGYNLEQAFPHLSIFARQHGDGRIAGPVCQASVGGASDSSD